MRNDCTAEATCALAVNVPAKGWPIDLHSPMRAVTGVVVCDQHFGDCEASDFLDLPTGGMRKLFEVLAEGKQPPDFDRAYLSKIKLDDPVYLAMRLR